VIRPRLRPWWVAALLAALALTALYRDALRTPFLSDDHQFLEEAGDRPFLEWLTRPDPLGGYFRPLSRQVYFELLRPLAERNEAVLHAENLGVFLVSLALLIDLLALLQARGALAAGLYFAVLPFQRVNLTWVSCIQDLLALAATLGALACFRRGRLRLALLAYATAITSKEAALPLPAALWAWDAWVERRPWQETLRRIAPFGAVGLLCFTVGLVMRAGSGAAPLLHFDPAHFAAGYAHMIQSLLGLEQPGVFAGALLEHGPALAPLLLLVPLALWPPPRDPGAVPPGRPAALAAFSLVWLVAFGFVTGPVASTWSAYYYTLAAVGAALLAGLVLARADRWGWLALTAGLLWWHSASSGSRTFAVVDRPWVWTSHLTSFYFERASALTGTLSRQLLSLEPAPPQEARFFFATLPSWAVFQMGNGAQIRYLYRDPTLASFFYSQFSESTAADHPCRFIFWDGTSLRHLYAGSRDPFFQVGTDLLLLDRPEGAAHAFRRALASGGDRRDDLYWLGWAELWAGHREAAELSWSSFGARDAPVRWLSEMQAARAALEARDSLGARRDLMAAIESSIGRPEAHAVLGRLLGPGQPKYAMLELKVAAWLDPADGSSRRDLVRRLVAARLDEPARRELEALERVYPAWRSDTALAGAARTLEQRSDRGKSVIRF